jgi:hypothetical protein
MQRLLMLSLIVIAALTARVIRAQSTNDELLSAVYRLEISNCAYEPAASRSQTGFRVATLDGIVTTLHGLGDCATIRAVANDEQSIWDQLTITQVDLAHDVVLLSSPALEEAPITGLVVSTLSDSRLLAEAMRVVGYPNGSQDISVDEIPGIGAPTSLDDAIPDDQESAELIKRRSPDLTMTILPFAQPVQPGLAGAPLLDSRGRVVGVVQGGLADGAAPLSWAIPWRDLTFIEIVEGSTRRQLALLQQRDPGKAFAFSSTFLQPTDAGLPYLVLVLDETDAPIANAEVRLIHQNGEEISYTDSEGAAFFLLPAAEEYAQSEISIVAEGFMDYQGPVADPFAQTGETIFRLTAIDRAETEFEQTANANFCTFAFRIFDQKTEVPLVGATIYVALGIRQATGATDSTGYYASSLPCANPQNSQVAIRVVADGYEAHRETVQLIDEVKEIALVPLRATPIPTPRPTPTASPTPEILFRSGDLVVAVSTLRIRAEPGLQAEILETLARSETFVIRSGPHSADGYDWWQLQELDGTLRGWAAYVVDEEEISLTLAPDQLPIPTSPALVAAPTPRPSSAVLEIIQPRAQESIIGKYEVRWRYRGELAPGQGFDLILWYPDDDKRRGIADAQYIAQNLIRHGNGEYSVAVNFSGAPAVLQYCDASYWLIVTVVQLDPYQRTGAESKGINVQVRPFPGAGC